MHIAFDSNIPIYSQIIDGFKKQICNGQLDPGQRIMPVRELSASLGVNPNTLQKALAELEQQGLMYTERTAGRFVTKDEYMIIRHRLRMMQELTGRYLFEMQELGCTEDEVLEIVRRNCSCLSEAGPGNPE